MGFFQTSARRYNLVLAAYCFLLAPVFGVTPFVIGADVEGVVIGLAIGAALLLLGCYRIWRARKSHPDSTVYVAPEAAPPNVQLGFYRRMAIVSLFAFPVLTFLTAWELRSLETGKEETVLIWVPLAWLYGAFGFWPTVLSVPVLGLLCLLVLVYKIRKLSAAQ